MKKSKKNEDWAKNQLEKLQEDTKPEGEKARELLTDILTRWSCPWDMDEDGAITFAYQGGNFVVHFSDETPFAYIYYPTFYSVESYLKDEMEKAKEVVNRMNNQSCLKVAYITDPDDGQLLVHAETLFPMASEIPHMEDYLKALLQHFFRLQHDFVFEMDSVE